MFLFKPDELLFNSIEALGHSPPIELLFVAVEVYGEYGDDETEERDPDCFKNDPDNSACGCDRVAVSETHACDGGEGPPNTILGVYKVRQRMGFFDRDDDDSKPNR